MNKVIDVKGMTCGHCVNSVTTELKKIAGVSEIEVDLATGKVTIQARNEIDEAVIAEAIDEAGYELVG
jgi:copper chaperone